MDDKLELLIESYGLETLLEIHDLRQDMVLKRLVFEGFIDLTDYFPEEEDE